MEIKLSNATYLVEFILIDSNIKAVSVLKVFEEHHELLGYENFNRKSTVEEFWAYIAKCFTEEECEELIAYEIQLEEAFLESQEDIAKELSELQMKKCDRCGEEMTTFRCSWFNTQDICLDCAEIESKHPKFKEAKKADHEHVVAGQYNFEGIGLPADFEEFAKNYHTQNRVDRMLKSVNKHVENNKEFYDALGTE